MSNEIEKTKPKRKLKTFQELHYDVEKAFENDEYKLLVNQNPTESWLKKQFQGNGKYLPIDKVEFLLDAIFQEWKVEVLSVNQIFNSIAVTIRLHYLSPLTGEWLFHDGVGAKGCQVNAKCAPSDMNEIKAEAVQMALPSAKSFAIKDAADHIGKIFGRDVNRKDAIDYQSAYKPENEKPDDKSSERILLLINSAKTKLSLESLLKDCDTPEAMEAYDNKLKTFK
jgi:hypothetical protein